MQSEKFEISMKSVSSTGSSETSQTPQTPTQLDSASLWWKTFSEKVRYAYEHKETTDAVNQIFQLAPSPLNAQLCTLYEQFVQINTEWRDQQQRSQDTTINLPNSVREFRDKHRELFEKYPKLAQRIIHRGVEPVFLRLSFAQAQEVDRIRNETTWTDTEKSVHLKQTSNTLTQFFLLQALYEARTLHCTLQREKEEE